MEWVETGYPAGRDRSGAPAGRLLCTPEALSHDRLAAVLISHLPGRLEAGADWVRAAAEAVGFCKERGLRLLTSAGLSCWEIPARIAGRLGLDQTVVLPPAAYSAEAVRDIVRELALDPALTCFVRIEHPDSRARREAMALRDVTVLNLANLIFPVAIRPEGRWERLTSGDDRLDRRFERTYPSQAPNPDYSGKDPSPEARAFPWEDYLIHFTRGTFGPWPGERRADYYDSLLEAERGNPRDGLKTLMWILKSGLLRGGDRLYREKRLAISFTEANPLEFLRCSTFRIPLHRRSAEPYGIAAPKDLLRRLGAQPAIYGAAKDYPTVPLDKRPYFQALPESSDGKLDWSREREWRLIGDLDLASLRGDVLFLAPSAAEAAGISEETGLTGIGLYR